MHVYGLTGGIGSGKSTVAAVFAELGLPVLSADELSREVVTPGSEGLAAVVAAFGPEVLTGEGTLDRPKLGRLVFADPARRKQLEEILHPRIRERFAAAVATLAAAGHNAVVYEVPLLFEKNLESQMHAVILVSAPEDLRVARVVARDGLDPGEVQARMAVQLGEASKRARADYIIENDGDSEHLRRQVTAVLTKIRAADLPLAGIIVIDASRMLPGAVLARSLIDLGARVIKVEDPRAGDLMRLAPPWVGGTGVGFCVFYRGAESVGLDLRTPDGAAALRCLAARADVLIESFRPGTMDRYGLGLAELRAANPRLITCSLPGFVGRTEVGHDLNFTAMTGLLRQTRDTGIPALQFADVTAGLLANTAILAALLRRGVSGRGMALCQPLATGPLPFVTWQTAEALAGGDGLAGRMLSGSIAAYRCYTCADGRELSVGCLEPKFWQTFATVVGRPDLAATGLDPGPDGAATATAMAEHLATRARDDWMACVLPHALPVWPVHDVTSGAHEPRLEALYESTPMPDGSHLRSPGPWLQALTATPDRPAPNLSADTQTVLQEFGAPPQLIERLLG